MFGEMNVVPIIDLRPMSEEVGGSVDGAMTRLLELTEHPIITKWVQLPKALLVFLLVPGDPESGAFYVYDRGARVWLWLDFDDEKFGGYTVSDFEKLVRECRFLDIVENPQSLPGKNRWTIRPGCRPAQAAAIKKSELRKKLARPPANPSSRSNSRHHQIPQHQQVRVPSHLFDKREVDV